MELPDEIISTCYCFGGRDIGVFVTHDGLSVWEDRTEGYEATHRLPDEAFCKIRDELALNYLMDVFPPGADEKLDEILEPIFWEHIAPQFEIEPDA